MNQGDCPQILQDEQDGHPQSTAARCSQCKLTAALRFACCASSGFSMPRASVILARRSTRFCAGSRSVSSARCLYKKVGNVTAGAKSARLPYYYYYSAT